MSLINNNGNLYYIGSFVYLKDELARGGVFLKKIIWTIVGLLVVVAIISAVIMNINNNKTKQTLMLKKDDLKSGEISDNWESFRKEQGMSNKDAKIKDFNLSLDKDKNIYSLQFTIIDNPDSNSYKVTDYEKCFGCDTKSENELSVTSSIKDKKPASYDKLIRADEFFSKLDTLNKQDFLTPKNFKYSIVNSTGAYRGSKFTGSYFVLDGNKLNKLAELKDPEKNYVGNDVQITGSNDPVSYQTANGTTKSVIIANYKE